MLGKRVILECDIKYTGCDHTYTGIETSEFAPRAKAIAISRFDASMQGWHFIPALISENGSSKDICPSCAQKQYRNLIRERHVINDAN